MGESGPVPFSRPASGKDAMFRKLSYIFREWMGELLAEWAIRVLPTFHTGREGMMRGLREQRDYDRYCGITQMLGEVPLPFDRWRGEWAGMKMLRLPNPSAVRRGLHIA